MKDDSGIIEDQGREDIKAVLSSILDAIPHAVLGLRERQIFFANRSVETVFGWKPEELIGKTTRILYRNNEEYEQIAEHAYPVLEKQRTYMREYLFRHKDGRDILCLVSASRIGEILKEKSVVVSYSDVTDKRKYEESLRLASIYSQNLIEMCMEPLAAIDPLGRITDVNAAVEKITGYFREELIGTDFSNYFTDQDKAKAVFKKVFNEGMANNCHLEICHRNGLVTHVMFNASVYRDAHDDVIGIIAAIRDITAHKRAEEALREYGDSLEKQIEERTDELIKATALLLKEASERAQVEELLKEAHVRLINFLDGLDSAVYVIDMNSYDVIYANKFMKSLLGDIVGQKCWESIKNLKGPCEFCVNSELLKSEARVSDIYAVTEQYFAKPDIWVQAQTRVIHWLDGQVVRLEIAADITKRKKYEQIIRQIQIQQATILDNIPDIAWLKDKAGKYILLNEAFANSCGMKKEDIIGATDFDVWPTDLAEKYQDDDKRVIECGVRKRVEELLVDKDGREIWVETIKTPIFNDNNEVIGTAGIARNITQHKRSEEELIKRGMELEAKSKNLEEINIALKILLKRREDDKKDLEEKLLENIKNAVCPYIEKLKKSGLRPEQATYAAIIEKNLNDIVSPFLRNISSRYLNLTPREIQVANLVKDGKTTKKIAYLLNSSRGAIDFHRNNIRNKLGIKGKNKNLRSHLLSYA